MYYISMKFINNVELFYHLNGNIVVTIHKFNNEKFEK